MEDLEAHAAELEARLTADDENISVDEDVNFDDYSAVEMAALEADFADMEADMTA